VVEEAVQLKIEHLTLYAFSTENWSRPQEEIGVLMKLLVSTLKSEFEKLLKNRIKLNVIGNLHQLPEIVQKELHYVVEKNPKQQRNDIDFGIELWRARRAR
jgi:undecaprenyl diphosphate synthase